MPYPDGKESNYLPRAFAMKTTLPYEKFISGYLRRQKELCNCVIFSLLWARRAAQQTTIKKESAGRNS
jgi:hypothetical protein